MLALKEGQTENRRERFGESEIECRRERERGKYRTNPLQKRAVANGLSSLVSNACQMTPLRVLLYTESSFILHCECYTADIKTHEKRNVCVLIAALIF